MRNCGGEILNPIAKADPKPITGSADLFGSAVMKVHDMMAGALLSAMVWQSLLRWRRDGFNWPGLGPGFQPSHFLRGLYPGRWPCPGAKGAPHTSPGQRPGFDGQQI